MASRDPTLLTPVLQEKLKKLIEEMKDLGYDLFPTCTYRSPAEQNELYAIGRTVNVQHAVVTKLRGGKSKHNSNPAKAFDVAILVKGKLTWNVKSDPWVKAREIGASLGLRNLYPFESSHFELPESYTSCSCKSSCCKNH